MFEFEFKFKFEREHVIKAIRKVEQRGLDWLYKKYPKKKGGGISKARTWFLIHEGAMYPLKHLGRCAYLHRPSNQPIFTSIFDKTYLNQYVE